MNNKTITRGRAARDGVKAGVDRAAEAVAPTLGAVGMAALIEYPGLDPITADDGVTVLRNLRFKDRLENMGLDLLRKGAVRSSTKGGDGTATTTVLTQALAHEAFAEVKEDGSNIRQVKERLDRGLAETLASVKAQSRPVRDEDLERIAEVSTLDPEVAKLIAEAIREVGATGAITVEKGAALGYSVETVKGMRFDRGLISPFFINDHENAQADMEDAYVVLVDRTVSSNEQIIGLLNDIGTGESILIVATDVSSVALGTLAANAMKGVARIACVQNPFQASAARDFLFDLAAITGATVISEEAGMKMSEATKALCGRAKHVTSNRDQTTVVGGAGDTTARVAELQAKLEKETSDYQRDLIKDRIAQLTGGVAVVRVGAYTDTEYNAKKFKLDNGIASTQAAMQEGILPGGGVAMLNAALEATDPMFRQALQAPFRRMARNAGMEQEPELAVASIGFVGVDFRNGKHGDMFEAGIVDPHKVVRTAIESAVAMTKQLIGFETAITDEEPAPDNQG